MDFWDVPFSRWENLIFTYIHRKEIQSWISSAIACEYRIETWWKILLFSKSINLEKSSRLLWIKIREFRKILGSINQKRKKNIFDDSSKRKNSFWGKEKYYFCPHTGPTTKDSTGRGKGGRPVTKSRLIIGPVNSSLPVINLPANHPRVSFARRFLRHRFFMLAGNERLVGHGHSFRRSFPSFGDDDR